MGSTYKINLLNKNHEFLAFRERNSRLYSHLMVILCIIMIMGFYILDIILKQNNLRELLLVRSVTSIILVILSIIIAFSRPSRILNKIHIYAGYYIVVIYSGILTHFSGGIHSSYWGGMNFVLLFWLTLVPFSYKETIANSFIFITVYDSIVLMLNTGTISWDKFTEYHFFFFGTLMLCSLVSYVSNRNEAIIYTKQQELENERNKLKLKNDILERDISLAKKIHFQLIPKPDPTEYIYSLYKPMQEVGGDLYEFVRFRDSKKIGIFISDVSGHGVPAALISSMIKTTILQSGMRKENPAELMNYINEVLQDQTAGNFITAFYGIYEHEKSSLLYANAGHPRPYLITDSGITQIPKGRSTPLAMFHNNIMAGKNKSYQNFEINLPSNSKLLFYTDGLTETRPINDNIFFEDSIMTRIFMKHRNNPSRLFIYKLFQSLVAFRGKDFFEDDICLVCLDVE